MSDSGQCIMCACLTYDNMHTVRVTGHHNGAKRYRGKCLAFWTQTMASSGPDLPESFAQLHVHDPESQAGKSTEEKAPFGCVRDLLQRVTVKEYLDQRPPSHVVTFDVRDTVSDVLKKLANFNILSAPLFDAETGSYYGFLDRWDLLLLVLESLDVRQVDKDERAYRLERAGRFLANEIVGNLFALGDGELVYRANESQSLFNIVKYGFEHTHGKGKVCHRVAIFDFADHERRVACLENDADTKEPGMQSADTDWSGHGDTDLPRLKVLSVLSQTDVLRFILQNGWECTECWCKSINSLGLGLKKVVCVPCDMPTINAFATMAACDVSSVGVVNQRNGGALVANLSASDLRNMHMQEFGLLAMPVFEFLKLRGSPGNSPRPSRRSTNEWGVRCGHWEPKVGAVSGGDTLGDVIELMVKDSYHRVYVVDENRRPKSIITMTDVLQQFLGM